VRFCWEWGITKTYWGRGKGEGGEGGKRGGKREVGEGEKKRTVTRASGIRACLYLLTSIRLYLL